MGRVILTVVIYLVVVLLIIILVGCLDMYLRAASGRMRPPTTPLVHEEPDVQCVRRRSGCGVLKLFSSPPPDRAAASSVPTARYPVHRPTQPSMLEIPCTAGGLINVTTLVRLSRQTQTTVSHHLGKLKALRLVNSQKKGKEVGYEINPSLVRLQCVDGETFLRVNARGREMAVRIAIPGMREGAGQPDPD